MSTALAPETIEITLEDIAPPCELTWQPPSLRSCDNSAEWVGLLRCCGAPRILCEEHREAYDWYLDKQKEKYRCITCGQVLFSCIWASLEKI